MALLLLAVVALGGLSSGPVAAAQPGYAGYGSKSPTPSRTKSRPPAAPPTTMPAVTTSVVLPHTSRSQTDPGGELPQTHAGATAVTGVMLVGAGIGFLGAWWLWQARIHGRTRVRGRGVLDGQPGHRHR